MKKKLFIIALIITLIGCGNSSNSSTISNTPNTDSYVEVLYFHGKQRCMTCQAIENLTKEVITNDFANELKKGKIIFRVIDISTPEGEKIADKYEVTFSSLFINIWQSGKETKNDMTDFGFSKAQNAPAIFKAGIKEKINQFLQ